MRLVGEVLRGGLAVLAVVVAVQGIGLALPLSLDMVEDPYLTIIQLGVWLAVPCVVLGLVAALSASWLGSVAAGWLGMVTGRCPYEYGRDDGNGRRAVGGLVLAGLCALAGWYSWQGAVETGESFRLVAGLLFVAGGGMVGVATAVPRIYFSLRPGDAEPPPPPSELRKARKKEKKRKRRAKTTAPPDSLPTLREQAEEQASMLAVLTTLGLMFATCTTWATTKEGGEPTAPLRFGDFVSVCLDSDDATDDCLDSVRLSLTRDDGSWVRLRYLSSCPDVTVEASDGQPVGALDSNKRRRLGIPADEGRDSPWTPRYLVFETRPGVEYAVVAHTGARSACDVSARYILEPVMLEATR